MFSSKSYLATTVGRKYLVGFAGVIWSLFVMGHMIGNLLMFGGPELYNRYSHYLASNPLVYGIEFILLLLITMHVVLALSLKLRNLHTKPIGYAVAPSKNKSANLSSQTMVYSGTAILAFLIWHVATFKYGPEFFVTYNGVEMRDMYGLVAGAFQNKYYVALYCVSVFLVGTHLFHGVKASFQTFGFAHVRYNKLIHYFGYCYAIVVGSGFFVLPVYVYFFAR